MMHPSKIHLCRLCLLLTLASFVTHTLHAQEACRSNALTDSAWAIQFQIGDNLSLGPFQGFTVSGKRHSSPHHAIRLGIGTSANVTDETRSSLSPYNDSLTRVTGTTDSYDSQGLTLNVQFITYPSPTSDINIYYGLGPVASYSRSHNKRTSRVGIEPDVAVSQPTTSESISWSAGGAGVFGAEWFAGRTISFLAEYSLSVAYLSTTRTDKQFSSNNRESTNETSSKRLSLSSGSLRFGLSAYF